MAKFEISTKNIESQFEGYFSLENNRRIIFSGIFGAGKTTFIRKYFNNRTDKYFHIHLFPVSYSVASNEDIFELIKYDILYELLKYPSIRFDTIKSRVVDVIHFTEKKSLVNAFRPLISIIPKIEKVVEPLIEVIENIIGLYSDKKEILEQSDLEKIKNFVSQFEDKTGSIYELDFHTKLICEIIREIKEDGQLVVVTIDDLDRIDPEHIFRILNIFGAHMDQDQSKNKFEIDKIITCFDINNLKKIFATKYGPSVDFSGYIDKFYSIGIFPFSNSDGIETNIERIFNSITFSNTHFLSDHNFKPLVISILKHFFITGNLNLRTLLKYSGEEYLVPLKYIRIELNSGNAYMHQVPILVVFDFLSNLFGGIEMLLKAIDNSNYTLPPNSTFSDRYLCDLLLVTDLYNNNINHSAYENPTITHSADWGTVVYIFKTEYDGNGRVVHLYGQITDTLTHKRPHKSHHKQILKDAINSFSLLLMN